MRGQLHTSRGRGSVPEQLAQPVRTTKHSMVIPLDAALADLATYRRKRSSRVTQPEPNKYIVEDGPCQTQAVYVIRGRQVEVTYTCTERLATCPHCGHEYWYDVGLSDPRRCHRSLCSLRAFQRRCE